MSDNTTTNDQDQDQQPQETAAGAEGTELQHTEGGQTTRSDAADLGVPMLPGDPDEPVGPEDALGRGPKRGDYRDRVGPSNYHPQHAVRTGRGREYELLDQKPLAEDIGDVSGKKGGVDTAS